MSRLSAVKSVILNGVRRALIASGADERLARRTQGLPPRALLARLAPMHTLYQAPTVRNVVRDGLQMELDVSDYMQWCAFYGIATEPRATLYALAHEGDVVFDVGTNVGETVLNLARRVGPGGVVHGFEPNPQTMERCRRNVEANAVPQVRLHQLGLGHEETVLCIERGNSRNTGEDRLLTPDEVSSPTAERVPVTTLDKFVEQQGVTRLDLLKIDVEGFETNIVRGGRQSLRSLRPTVFIEVSDKLLRRQGSSSRELVEQLIGLGYRLRHAELGSEVRASDSFEGSHAHFDVIGVAG